MKTLILSPYSPYPTTFGGAIRVYQVIRMFAECSDVTLVTYLTPPADAAAVRHLETICERVVAVEDSPMIAPGKWRRQARSLLSARPFQYYSFHSRQFQRAIDAALQRQRFDAIVFEQVQMAYFRGFQPGALRILDQHNIESELLQRRVGVQANPFKRAALALEARKFSADERALSRAFDLILAPSDRERDQLRALLAGPRVETLPNSIDPEYFGLRPEPPPGDEIAFIGTTHVDANRDGLIYFMEAIFPLIERLVPSIRFSIVGGNPPPSIRRYAERPNVTVTGFVPDVRPYMARAQALVVPLRTGGGTRLKILEGLSYGVPTVSTSLGAEGLDLTHGEHLLLADTPESFAASLAALLRDADLRRRLRDAGRRIVEERYSWRAVGRRLDRYLREMPAPRQLPDAALALEKQP